MSSALLFEFTDEASAQIAAGTLAELGYELVQHDGQRLHVHVEERDYTSVVEIAQASGGQLSAQSLIRSTSLLDSAYSMDAITIPYHVVNEDWSEDYAVPNQVASELGNRSGDMEEDEEFLLSEESYDHMSGDVHI
ncbi:hypothetical protein ACFO9Q_05355 [Paenibacillus sp. GCM10023252]|uniref:hypothetical protein n=1 Tax=Paenibacillus sp. GCM10023252 TaxID=3252649 RepID=UPI0036146456